MSNSTKPLISIIIAAYNGEKYLAEAINSALAQDYRPIEIIVVDDGSVDQTAKIAQSFPLIKYQYQTNAGAAAARNRGIKLATGDFLSFLDADDLWTTQKLSQQIAAFEQQPTLDLIFGQIAQFISPELAELKEKYQCPSQPMPGYSQSTMLIKRDSFWQVGLFSGDLRLGDFMDWYFRAKEKSLKSLMLPDILLNRRIHNTNTGIIDRQSRAGYAIAIKNALDRRRKITS